MSSITFSTVVAATEVHAGEAPAWRPKTRLRITQRGRRVVALLVAAPFVVALLFVLLFGGGHAGGAANASSEPHDHAVSFQTVTVLPGDTLWSIAEMVAPDADPRYVVRDIQRLNVLPAGVLEIGQVLAIPVEYAADK